jgi:hypothetical protein
VCLCEDEEDLVALVLCVNTENFQRRGVRTLKAVPKKRREKSKRLRIPHISFEKVRKKERKKA